MKDHHRLQNLILINGIILLSVSIPHLIDDFLFGIPDEFGITNIQAQALSGIFSALLILIFAMAGRGSQAGIPGIFLALAGIFKHLPLILKPGPTGAVYSLKHSSPP